MLNCKITNKEDYVFEIRWKTTDRKSPTIDPTVFAKSQLFADEEDIYAKMVSFLADSAGDKVKYTYWYIPVTMEYSNVIEYTISSLHAVEFKLKYGEYI